MRPLKEMREALRLSVKRFADEAGVSTRTVQDTEGGKTPRRATAEKYAAVLRRYGVDPSEVREVAEGLGVLFTVVPDPFSRLRSYMLRSVREGLIGLVRNGDEAAVRKLVDEVISQHGEAGARRRAEVAEAHLREAYQEEEGGQM